MAFRPATEVELQSFWCIQNTLPVRGSLVAEISPAHRANKGRCHLIFIHEAAASNIGSGSETNYIFLIGDAIVPARASERGTVLIHDLVKA